MCSSDPPGAVPTCTGGMQKRWVAGKQVRYNLSNPTDVSGAVPKANIRNQQRFGWSTLPGADAMQIPQRASSKCIREHPVPTSGTDESNCKKLCEDDDEFETAGIDPDFVPKYDYPVQMRSQSVVAGTNTVAWHSQARGFGDQGFEGYDCSNSNCPTLPASNIACKCNFLQYKSPNGGIVTYGVIYAGDNLLGVTPAPGSGSALGSSFDKYLEANPYRYGNGSPCDTSLNLYQINNYTFPSKPWGPGHFVMWNGLGSEKNDKYPQCFCCTGSMPLRIPPSGILRVAGGWDGTWDGFIGSVEGFPPEQGLNCSGDSNYVGCAMTCEAVLDYATPSVANNSYFGIPFCAYHRAQSYASSRKIGRAHV